MRQEDGQLLQLLYQHPERLNLGVYAKTGYAFTTSAKNLRYISEIRFGSRAHLYMISGTHFPFEISTDVCISVCIPAFPDIVNSSKAHA